MSYLSFVLVYCRSVLPFYVSWDEDGNSLFFMSLYVFYAYRLVTSDIILN